MVKTSRRLKESRIPLFFLFGYLALFAAAAIHPYDRAVWWAENIPVVLIVGFLVAAYPKFRFSNLAYLMMSVFLYLHTVGGHYTFERVPFGWFSELLGSERNHYDRLAHFSVGFYAFAICEFLDRKNLTNSVWVTCLFAVFAIFTVASLYEIIEWQYAVSADPTAGSAFLGSQGDIWDAQKDMLADGLGAITAVLVYFSHGRSSRKRK